MANSCKSRKGIVRHRGKIEAVVNNAGQARELVKREGSLAAFMQVMGLINDHVADCVVKSKVERVRTAFSRPG